MARKTKAEKAAETLVEQAFNRNCSNVQFNIMDLSNIMKAGKDAIREGRNLDEAMIEAREKFRKN